MKRLLFLAALAISFNAYCQDITKGNTCYEAKDYACAVDNYQRAYNNQTYTTESKHIVEARLGTAYGKLKQNDAANDFFLRSVKTKPDYLDGWWSFGDLLYNTKKYDSAAVVYKKALSLSADADEIEIICYWLASAYYSKKDYKQALTYFNAVKQRTGSRANTDALMGQAYYERGYYDSAVIAFKKAFQTVKPGDETYADKAYNVAKSFKQAKRSDSAMVWYDMLLSKDRDYELAIWDKGIVYNQKKEYAKAVEWYSKALPFYKDDSSNLPVLYNNIKVNYELLGDYTNAVSTLNKSVPFAKDKIEAYITIAGIQYGKLNKPKDAEKTIQTALEAWKQLPDTSFTYLKTKKARLLSVAALTAADAKDSSRAEKLAADALRYNSDNYEANLLMGDYTWGRGKKEDSKKYYLKLTSYSSPDTLFSGKTDRARFYARKAFINYNFNAVKPYNIKSDVEDALRLDSMQKEAVQLWWITLFESYSIATYREQCIALMDRAINAYKNDKKYVAELYNGKALMYDTKKDTLNSRLNLERAIKADPENINAWDNFLKYLTNHNAHTAGLTAADQLIAQLKKMKDTNGTISVAFIYKGDFYWRMGKKEEAKSAYSEALVWDSGNTTAKERSKMQ